MPNARDELHQLLTQIANRDGDPVVHAQEALRLMSEMDQKGVRVVRGGAEVEYVVEKSANGETLAERRKTGKAQPFRCPKPVYEALVQVLAANERALPLDELVPAVAEVLGDHAPAFQVRVPLRLWMHVEPPLVVRNRARYRPVDAKTFAAMANDLWNSLRK